MNRGKLVILAMVLVGGSMATFAWIARYQASQAVLDRFGADVAIAVRKGKKVELLTLSSPNEGAESTDRIQFELNGVPTTLAVQERRDITDAKGLIHARHHLLHRNGFDWEATLPSAHPDWKLALRFTHEKGQATWLLDFDQQRTFIVEVGTDVSMQPISRALKTFLNDVESASANAAEAVSTVAPETATDSAEPANSASLAK